MKNEGLGDVFIFAAFCVAVAWAIVRTLREKGYLQVKAIDFKKQNYFTVLSVLTPALKTLMKNKTLILILALFSVPTIIEILFNSVLSKLTGFDLSSGGHGQITLTLLKNDVIRSFKFHGWQSLFFFFPTEYPASLGPFSMTLISIIILLKRKKFEFWFLQFAGSVYAVPANKLMKVILILCTLTPVEFFSVIYLYPNFPWFYMYLLPVSLCTHIFSILAGTFIISIAISHTWKKLMGEDVLTPQHEIFWRLLKFNMLVEWIRLPFMFAGVLYSLFMDFRGNDFLNRTYPTYQMYTVFSQAVSLIWIVLMFFPYNFLLSRDSFREALKQNLHVWNNHFLQTVIFVASGAFLFVFLFTGTDILEIPLRSFRGQSTVFSIVSALFFTMTHFFRNLYGVLGVILFLHFYLYITQQDKQNGTFLDAVQ